MAEAIAASPGWGKIRKSPFCTRRRAGAFFVGRRLGRWFDSGTQTELPAGGGDGALRLIELVLRLLVWIAFIPWWLYLCWSVMGGTFERSDLAGMVPAIVFWAGYKAARKYNERHVSAEDLVERYRTERDRGRPLARARERNQWRENRWKIHK